MKIRISPQQEHGLGRAGLSWRLLWRPWSLQGSKSMVCAWYVQCLRGVQTDDELFSRKLSFFEFFLTFFSACCKSCKAAPQLETFSLLRVTPLSVTRGPELFLPEPPGTPFERHKCSFCMILTWFLTHSIFKPFPESAAHLAY